MPGDLTSHISMKTKAEFPVSVNCLEVSQRRRLRCIWLAGCVPGSRSPAVAGHPSWLTGKSDRPICRRSRYLGQTPLSDQQASIGPWIVRYLGHFFRDGKQATPIYRHLLY
jgi:hypothetical protein